MRSTLRWRRALSTDPVAPPLLEMRGISRRFGSVQACENVDLTVGRGEILALLGENGAGKTTLMNVVYGLVQPDNGYVLFDGEPVEISSPADATRLGIGMVHQHFQLVPNMTVAENVALANSRGSRLLDLDKIVAEIRALGDAYGLAVDPNAVVRDLPLGVRQRVEIIKGLLQGARLLIMDEPTAVLTPQEWSELAEIMTAILRDGRSVVFITHKLEEPLQVANRCTVLRDGRVVGTVRASETSKEALARMMVGRDVVLRVTKDEVEVGAEVLGLKGLTVVDDHSQTVLSEVSLAVREGEIFGIAGVEGNGQSELVDVLAGAITPRAGTLRVGDDEHDLTRRGVRGSLDAGVIPADRHRHGVALDLSLLDNLMMRDFASVPFASRGVLARPAVVSHCTDLVARYDIRTPDVFTAMRTLSGGNQQKAVLARELNRAPALVVAAQPTRGLDVGAMEFVYETLLECRRQRGAVLLISSELDEILTLSDRFAVLAGGRIMAVLRPEDANPETVGMLMAGEARTA